MTRDTTRDNFDNRNLVWEGIRSIDRQQTPNVRIWKYSKYIYLWNYIDNRTIIYTNGNHNRKINV